MTSGEELMPLSQRKNQTDLTSMMHAGNILAKESISRRASVDTWSFLTPIFHFTVSIGARNFHLETDNPDVRNWLAQAANELNRIANLPVNWDSYGAMKVNQLTLESATEVLVHLMGGQSVLPHITASVNGGVELEWHGPGMGLEIEVRDPSMVHAYFYDDDRPNDEWEDDVSWRDDVKLRAYIDRVTA